MEQFEQLLTCCVCLDRYRNPKLLPCQHSFCMEPCMEGLADYVRRQVKCPECRAEHRIPYQGVQAFPTNVTLQRFLELHIEISGELPDPTAGQIMERCNVCSEKAYLSVCAHCEKKICEDCKSAHMDILRREIVRINSQVRRNLHRLQDSLSNVEKNTISLQTNCLSVIEELEEIQRRVTKAIKDRSENLRGEVDRYLTSEMRNLSSLKQNLELEITNIQSNCDVVDKYMNDNIEWDDAELMDTKEIFLKTAEFLRHFEYESADYSRRVRFLMSMDPNQLVMNLASFGDLNITPHSTLNQSASHLAPPSTLQPGLMRSKSDHRLASQFRQQDERGYNEDEPILGGRKFGERPPRVDRFADTSSSRYSRPGDYDYEYDNEPATRPSKSRFRSRFVRSHQADNESDNETSRSVRTDKDKGDRDRVIDTEDVSRGALSGIIRLSDSPRVIKRLQETEKGKKEKKEVAPTPPVQQQVKPAIRTRPAPPPAARQVSEDDEIGRIKRQNKGTTSTAATAHVEPERPAADRVAALKRTPASATSEESDSSHTSSVRRTPPQVEADSDSEESDGSITSPQQSANKTPSTPTTPKKTTRSTSSDSTASSESSSSSAVVSATPASRTATVDTKSRFGTRSSDVGLPESPTTRTPPTPTTEKKPFQSRFLPQHNTHAKPPEKKEESESSTEEETSTEESEEEEEESKKTPAPTITREPISSSTLNRSSQARDTAAADARRSSRDETSLRSTYSTPSYGTTTRTRPTTASHHEPDEPTSRYGGTSSGSSYTSRFLNKSKSTAVVPPPDDDNATGDDSDSRYGTGRSRYLAMKERRNRLARSRSTHTFGNDDDDLDEPVSPTTASPSAYLASRISSINGFYIIFACIYLLVFILSAIGIKLNNAFHHIQEHLGCGLYMLWYGPSSYGAGSSDLSRSRSSHALKSRENSPERGAAGSSKDGDNLSSWARYLRNKYGNRSSKDSSREGPVSQPLSSTSSSAARRLSLGLPLRQANEMGSSDDDSKNGLGSPTSPTVAAGITGVAGISPRMQYLRKRQQLFQLGGRGSEPGCFTWPRGIAVGPDNSIVVADSSNHRVQVFDSNGIFVKEFGEYGNGEGEFDCLAGVAVTVIGQYIIADRYNHRIQVLDPQGRFLRAFGSQGTTAGKFNYPWGVATDALGFIYVCDKENHRIQVFQSDGTFVGKFGSCGRGEGQLEHPHYIAVSKTNRVIVSDSNNHRIQIFDVNGNVLSTFGSEGSEEGQFKFPRGVAVDDQGYICVADSGNNRIQIFQPDGSFLKAFGSWGSGECEFKGLEGVAIMSNGNILVCDRENHRVQVF